MTTPGPLIERIFFGVRRLDADLPFFILMELAGPIRRRRVRLRLLIEHEESLSFRGPACGGPEESAVCLFLSYTPQITESKSA